MHSHGHDYAFASLVTAHTELDFEAVTQAIHELKLAGLIDPRAEGS